jgi:hypothetical protein
VAASSRQVVAAFGLTIATLDRFAIPDGPPRIGHQATHALL